MALWKLFCLSKAWISGFFISSVGKNKPLLITYRPLVAHSAQSFFKQLVEG